MAAAGDEGGGVPPEFQPPLRPKDLLEPAEGEPRKGVYYVTNPTPVEHMDEEQFTEAITALHARICTDGVHRVSGDPFDEMHSIIMHIDQVGQGPLHLLASNCTELLQRAVKTSEQLLKDGTMEDFVVEVAHHRNALKMLAWVVARVLTHSSKTPCAEQAAAPKGKKKGKGAAARDRPVSVDKEKVLKVLVQTLSPEVSGLWPGGTPDEPYVQMLLRLLVHLMEVPDNLRAPPGHSSSPVREGIFELLLAIAKRYATKTRVSGEHTAAPPDAPSNRPSAGSEDILALQSDAENPIVAPLVELATGQEHIPKYLAQMMKMCYGEAWGRKFVDELLFKLTDQALQQTAEGQGSKNIGSLVSDLAELLPEAIESNLVTMHQMLQSEGFAIRKAALNGFGQVLCKMESSRQRRSELIEVLVERILDVNSWVRICALNNVKMLAAKGRIPIKYQNRVLALVTGRLRDRTSFVRSSAMACLGVLVACNVFGDMLRLSNYTKHYTHNLEILSAHRNGATPEQVKEEVAAYEKVVHDDSGEQDEQGTPDERWSEAERKLLGLLSYYQRAVHFIERLHSAVPVITGLLNSRTTTDCLEAIKLLTTCVCFKIEEAVKAVPSICVQIFHREQSVHDQVLASFHDIFVASATSTDDAQRQLQVALQLLRIFPKANEGVLSALERILSCQGVDFCDQLSDAVWSVADGSCQKAEGGGQPSPTESQSAMRLFAMLCATSPEIAVGRFDDLCSWGLKRRAHLGLATHACHALTCMSKAPGFEPLPESHPVFASIAQTLLGSRRASINAWVPMARAAAGALYALAAKPERLAKLLLEKLHSKYLEARSRLMRARESEVKAEPCEGDGVAGTTSNLPDVKSAEKEVQGVLARLLFLLGETAMLQLVFFESEYSATLRKIHNDKKAQVESDGDEKEAIEEELGLQSKGALETTAEDTLRREERRILRSDSVWGSMKSLIIETCLRTDPSLHGDPWLRSTAVLALCMYMMVTEDFAKSNVQWLFSILKATKEPWIRINIAVAVGDLMCRWPNTMEPWSKQFFAVLHDADEGVRSTAYLVATHLILNDMLKARQFIHVLCAGLVDPSPQIQGRSSLFVSELASKDKEKIFQIFPDVMSSLSRDEAGLSDEDFRGVMKHLLDYIDKEKQLEALVGKLCLKLTQAHDVTETTEEVKGEVVEGEVSPDPPNGNPPVTSEVPAQRRLARRVVACLAMLDLKQTSERALKRLCSDACFKCYHPFISDPQVHECLKEIAAKARRPVPGQRERPEVKALLDEWEAKLDEGRSKEASARECEVRAKAAKPAGKKPRGKASKRSVEESSEESSSDEEEEEEEDESASSSAREDDDGKEEEEETPPRAARGRGGGGRGRGRGAAKAARKPAPKKRRRKVEDDTSSDSS